MAKKKGFFDAVKENLGMGSPMDDSSNDNKDPKKDTSPDDNKDPKKGTKSDDGKEPDKDPKKDTKSDGNKEPDKDSKKDAKTDSSKDSKKDSRSDTKTDTNDPDDDPDDADNADDNTGSKRSINDVSKAIIDDIVNSGGDATSKDDSDQPKEARNMVRGLKFYEKVAEKIHDYDATGVMAPELKDWIATAIEDEKELSEMLVRRALPRVLAKNPGLIKEAKEVAKAATNHGPVPFKYFFINAKDSSDKKEYATFDEARESIKKEIDLYGVDPKQVFRVIYRRVDASGKLGEIVSADVVETYIENFDGDKNTLRQTLRLPKKDNKNPSNGQQRKKGTAANNSDSSNTSSHNGTGKS